MSLKQINITEAAGKANFYAAALGYINAGLSVLPVDGKKPAVVRRFKGEEMRFNWSDYQKKLTPAPHVDQWQKQNYLTGVGIISGEVSQNLVVIDLDGLGAVEAFEDEFPHYLDTFIVRSGSGKGEHIYLQVEDFPANVRIKTGVGGFEVRGNGCYVVAPPSIHPNSQQPYTVDKALPVKRVAGISDIITWLGWIKEQQDEDRTRSALMPAVTPISTPRATTTRQDTSKAAAQTYLSKAADTVRTAGENLRNDTLNRAAFNVGQLVASGDLSQSEVEAVLTEAALAVGLEKTETAKTIRSGLNAGMARGRPAFEPKNGNGASSRRTFLPDEEPESDIDEESHKPDDDEISLDIAAQWADRVSFFHGEWRVFERGCWASRADSETKRGVRKMLRKYRRVGVTVTQSRVNSITAMLQDDLYVPDRIINELAEQRSRYIPLQNGLLNVETMDLEQHRPEIYISSQLPFSYDPGATCPNFMRYLNTSLVLPKSAEPDSQMIMFLQEFLGYALTAQTHLKASVWMVGQPDSGKSTLISFIRSLAGTLHGTIDLNQIANNRFILAGIVGKRIVTFTEASANSMLPTELYKAMVGGSDEIWTDVKNRDAISFRPEAKFIWAMNEAPRVSDRSGATFNRLFPIMFNRSIPKHQRIQNLDQRLAAERAGVFNWAMEGLMRLTANRRLTLVDQAEEWKTHFIMDNDTEGSFFEDKLIRSDDNIVSSSELYSTYKGWCEEYGFRARNINQAAKEWERLGLEKVIRDGRRFWKGAKFRN